MTLWGYRAEAFRMLQGYSSIDLKFFCPGAPKSFRLNVL